MYNPPPPPRRTVEITASTEHSPWGANTSTVTKFPTCYGTPRFIAVFTTALLSTSQEQRVRFFLVINDYKHKRVLKVSLWKLIKWGTFGIVDVSLPNIEKYDKCHGNETVTRLLCCRYLYCSVLMHTKDAILNGTNWGTDTKTNSKTH
jgi:hypothetical protein